MISNPDMMRQMMAMQGGGGMGGGPSSGAPQPGLFGLAQQQQQQGQAGAGAGTATSGAPGSSGAPAAGAQNPFAGMEALLGGAGAAGAGGGQNPLAGLFGAGSLFGGAGAGGFNPPAAQPADTRPPEERFEVCFVPFLFHGVQKCPNQNADGLAFLGAAWSAARDGHAQHSPERPGASGHWWKCGSCCRVHLR